MSTLEKIRKMNIYLNQPARQIFNFQELLWVLGECLGCGVYLLNEEGSVLGQFLTKLPACCQGYGERLEKNWTKRVTIITQTVCTKMQHCFFQAKNACSQEVRKSVGVIPINSKERKLGNLVLVCFDKELEESDLIIAEYLAALMGGEMQKIQQDQVRKVLRDSNSVQTAFKCLSHSEKEAVKYVLAKLEKKEGFLVISRLAAKIGVDKAAMVNGLKKLASARLLEVKSLGAKGTYLRVFNEQLLKVL